MVKIDHNDVPRVDCLAQYLTSHFKVAGMPLDRPLGPMFQYEKAGLRAEVLKNTHSRSYSLCRCPALCCQWCDIRLHELLTI